MRAKLGKTLIILGAVLLLAALSLFTYNMHEAAAAADASAEAVISIRDGILARLESEEETDPYINPYEEETDEAPEEAAEEEPFFLDGYGYIGYLTLPTLGLELPVMSDWSYPKLKLSPCRYSGTASGHDLVIMAHNYSRHFGRIRDLDIGDEVCFVDMRGVIYTYEVAAHETMEATAIEHMTGSGYDLTLFTCTYGGQARVAVRLRLKNDQD